MNPSEYIETVKEQLRAYDFQARGDNNSFTSPLFYRKTEGRIRIREEHVLVAELDSTEVEVMKEYIDRALDVFSTSARENGRLDRRWWYLLLVPRSVSKPMNVAAKRAGGSVEYDGYTAQYIPIVTDLEDGRYECADPSGLQRATAFRKARNNVEDYFVV